MIYLVFIATILLIIFSGWIASTAMLMGFGPLLMRLLYLIIGLKSSTLLPKQTGIQFTFFIILLLTALWIYRASVIKIKNGEALSRVIPDVKWSMLFFIIGISTNFIIYLVV